MLTPPGVSCLQDTIDAQRLKWTAETDTAGMALAGTGSAARASADHTVTLKPRQIKTFLLNAQPLDPA